MDNNLEKLETDRENELMKKIEAALFISGRFLSLKEIVSLTDINPILVKKLIDDLSDHYKNSAVQIIKKRDMWKMDVSSDYVWLVNKLATGKSEFTKAEQETLAIIAYKQPIKQSVLVKIRGNKAYEHIKSFVNFGLITKKKSGRSWEINLSDSFYDYFHIEGDALLSKSEND